MAQSYFGNQKFNDGQAALAQANRARMLNQTGRFSIPEMPRGSGITDPRQLELMRAQQNMRGVSDNRQTAYIPSDMERAAAMMSEGGRLTNGEQMTPQGIMDNARRDMMTFHPMDQKATAHAADATFDKMSQLKNGNSYFNVDAYR